MSRIERRGSKTYVRKLKNEMQQHKRGLICTKEPKHLCLGGVRGLA